MKNIFKLLIFIFIFPIMFFGCNNDTKNNDTIYHKIDQINYLKDESSYSFKTMNDTVYFGAEIWLKNDNDIDIPFSIKVIFEDPILKRELGDEKIIGSEIYLKPQIFVIESGKKSVYGWSFKINKDNLSADELNKITNNVKVILFDESGYERIIEI